MPISTIRGTSLGRHFRLVSIGLGAAAILATLLVVISAPSNTSRVLTWTPKRETLVIGPYTQPDTLVGTRLVMTRGFRYAHIEIDSLSVNGLPEETLILSLGDSAATLKKSESGLEMNCGAQTTQYEIGGKHTQVDIDRNGKVQIDGKLLRSCSINRIQALLTSVRFVQAGAEPLTVRIQPINLGFELTRTRAAVLLVAGLLLVMSICGTTRRKAGVQHKLIARNASPIVVATALAVTIAGAFLASSYYDDGWVQASVQSVSQGNYFMNYFEQFGAFNPLGTLHNILFLPITHFNPRLVFWRIPAVIAIVIGFLESRKILYKLGISSGIARTTFVIVYAVGTTSWLFTLRPEPIEMMLLTVVLSIAVSLIQNQNWSTYPILGLISAIALSMHHTGAVVFFATAALPVVVALRDGRHTVLANLNYLVVSAVTFCVGFTLIVLGPMGFSNWVDNYRYVNSGVHSLTWRDELNRWAQLIDQAFMTPSRRISAFLILIACLKVLLWRKSASTERAYLNTAFVASFGSFIFFPSKWTWHFGSLVAVCAVILAVSIDEMIPENQVRTKKYMTVSIFSLMVLALSISVHAPNRIWGSLAGVDFVLVWNRALAGLLTTAVTLLLLAASVLLVMRGSVHLQRSWQYVLLVLILVVGVGGFCAEAVDGLRVSGWTEQKDSIGTEHKCELLEYFVTDAETDSLRASQISLQTVNNFVLSLGLSENPLPVSSGEYRAGLPIVYGTTRFTVGNQEGWFNAGSFLLDKDPGQIMIPLRGGALDGRTRIHLLWSNGRIRMTEAIDGGEIPRQRVPEDWSWIPVDRPSQLRVSTLTVIVEDMSPISGQNIEIGEPRLWGQSTILRDSATKGSTYVAPYLRGYFPCLELPKFNSGTETPAHFYIGDFTSNDGLGAYRHVDHVELKRVLVWKRSGPRVQVIAAYRFDQPYIEVDYVLG